MIAACCRRTVGLQGRLAALLALGGQRRHGIDQQAAVAAAVDVMLGLAELGGEAGELLVEPTRGGGEPLADIPLRIFDASERRS